MTNRIRDIRKAKGLTLADLAAACDPPTTAQTIGRLETGMRSLSLTWMNRIAPALGVDPASLMRADTAAPAQIIAELGAHGPEALTAPREALLPSELASEDAPAPLVLAIRDSVGEYRPGDLLWLRQLDPDDISGAINRDCLVPRSGGRFAFGRLIDRRGTLIGLLPPGAGQKQVVVDNPAWIAVAMMLVRPL
ncbi:helix-turn-helix domain-containing protein [Porphyrobacter sp. AAP60]|uniref:helix-turn-helix domain-containing protein n=1 Tax=Porphyrobacter sp. AAP60 TaxID=1523423 RepID=UPI0006B9F29B|nr:helix-turn-helix transcriptional regulator [Porphyrobacter sp. AAP60]KPF64903.1 XRE family transcriptional regulator [Porphyrobacter sp. AAP60]